MNKILWLATGAGVGGGLMFFLDPDRGRHRRVLVRDKVTSGLGEAGRTIRTTSAGLGRRAYGAVMSRRPGSRGEDDPSRLLARVRSAIGHAVSNARAIRLAVENGAIVVSGSVFENESQALLKAIRGVRGVTQVEERLEILENPVGRSGSKRSGTSTWRAVAGATGGALAAYGLTHRRQTLGRAASAAGFGLLAQSATSRGFRKLLRVVRIAA